jgi:hypothetical protein
MFVSTQGSDYDTVIAVYGGTSLTTLRRLPANDDCSPGVSYSCVSFRAGPGVVYSVQVMAAFGETGNLAIRAWVTTKKAAPKVEQ